MITITEAVLALRPNADFIVFGGTYDGIQWNDQHQTKPTEEEVNIYIATETEKIAIEKPLQDCAEKAKSLIASVDWSVLPDVNLQNKAEFEAYRAQLRALIVTPVANPVWPTEPSPVWS